MNHKNRILLISIIILLLTACNSSTEPDDIPRVQTEPTIKQGVYGIVLFWEGSFMPPATGTKTPVERMVLIYELTSSVHDIERVGNTPFYSKINTQLIDSVKSNSKGFFECSLPVGQYSIFVWEDSLLYSNRMDDHLNIFPFEIKKDSITELQFDITYRANF